MSNRYLPPDELLYLQPLNIQPYQIERCADWLVRTGMYVKVKAARDMLYWMQENNEPKFKGIMSTFFRETATKVSYIKERPRYKTCSDVRQSYGEAHMNYSIDDIKPVNVSYAHKSSKSVYY